MLSLPLTFGLQLLFEDVKLKLGYLGLFTIPLNSSTARACTQTRGTGKSLVSAIFSTKSRACLNLVTTQVNNPKARVFF